VLVEGGALRVRPVIPDGMYGHQHAAWRNRLGATVFEQGM